MSGKKHSDETKNKMSLSNKGISENTRRSHFKKIICVETKEVFNSQLEAQEKTGTNHKYISQCCTGRQNTTGGFHWKYYEDGNDENS